jgi:hypothetical protein
VSVLNGTTSQKRRDNGLVQGAFRVMSVVVVAFASLG